MQYIFEGNRDFYENFFNLLNNSKKDDFFNTITEEDVEEYNDDYEGILDILGLTVEESIYEYLHYSLEVYLEVNKDELGNTIPIILGIGKKYNDLFSGIIIQLDENGYYQTNYIINNERIDGNDEYEIEEKLKQFIGENNLNNTFILINDMLLYDDIVGTYVAMRGEFEENFSDKLIYIPIEGDTSSVYINSTLMKEDLNIYNEEI